MNVSDDLLRDKKVLLIWHGAHTPEEVQSTVEKLRERAASGGTILLEHSERIVNGTLLREWT